jgi:iron complex outermembrane receptor protein
LATLPLMAFQPARAAENAAADAAAAAPQPADAGGLEEITVTAQRREQTLERTPVAVTALGTEALTKSAITTEADLQTAVAGLTVKAGQNSDSLNFAIRGQSLDAYSGVLPGVLPYFNEVQFNAGDSTPLYDLQSVQVLKGPQGTLFGRNSTGGTVLYTSAKPEDRFGGYVAASGGNYGQRRFDGAVNLPVIDDKLLARVAVLYSNSNGYQFDTIHQRKLGGIERYAGRASLTFKPTDSFKNDLVVDYAHADGYSMSDVLYDIYPAGSTNAPAPANIVFTPGGFNATIPVPNAWDAYLAAHPGADPLGIGHFAAVQAARGPYTVSVSSLPFHQADNLILSNISSLDIATDVQLKNIFGYTNLRNFDGAEYDGSPYVVDERGTLGGRRRTVQYSDELQVIGKTLQSKLSYVTGIYLNDEKTDERTNSFVFDLSPFAPASDQINHGLTKRKSYALYGEGTYDLSEATNIEGLGFTLGARYTDEKVTFEHLADDFFITNPDPHYVTPLSDTFRKPSWHVGLQWQATESTMLYLTSRSSTRNGGFNFFSPPIPGLGGDGGSEYGVETATDVELGLKFRGRIADMPARFNAALYNLEVKDSQRVTYTVLFGALAAVTVNVPKTRVTGLELDGSISPTSWLQVGGSVNLTDPEFTSNQVSVLGAPPVAFGPVPDTPRRSGVGYAEVGDNVASETRLSLRLEGFAQSQSTFSSTGDTLNKGSTLPGYALVNARLTLESLDKGWSVAAYGKNLANKVYYVGGIGFGSLFTYNLAVPGLPRTYGVEARYKF